MKKLKSFLTFYGAKYRASKYYSPPKYNTIIEPFCGSAGYSIRYYDKNIILNDIDPIICGCWNYLINGKESEILSLPLEFDHIDDCDICQEAKWLIGFWINKCTVSPGKVKSAWVRSNIRPNSSWGECIRNRLANQLKYIRHWKVTNKSYEELDNIEGTWFIDPPYNNKAGRLYKYKLNDYEKLASWCQTRNGQVIVCENSGADWLPFKELASIKSNGSKRGKGYTKEVVYEY